MVGGCSSGGGSRAPLTGCLPLLCAVRLPRWLQIGALSGQTLPIGIAVLGVFILLLSLLGGVAAYKESRAFLLVYFLFLLLLTLVLFFVGIAVYVERNNAATYITQGWATASPDLRQSLEQIFACCGCCSSSYVQINATSTQDYPCVIADPALQQGCLSVFTSYFQQYYVTAGGCGIGFAVVMFAGMLVVCFLMQGIKQKRAEQDLAKLRANHNADEADIQLAMTGGEGSTTGGRRRKHQQEDDEEEEEDEEEEVDEEDEEQEEEEEE